MEVRTIASAMTAAAAAGDMASEIGFKDVERAKIAIATTELATNIAIHAMGKGRVTIRTVEEGPSRTGLVVIAIDEGPGIQDVKEALEGENETSTGLGIGLGAVRRLMDEFSITTKVGHGTTIWAAKWRQRDVGTVDGEGQPAQTT